MVYKISGYKAVTDPKGSSSLKALNKEDSECKPKARKMVARMPGCTTSTSASLKKTMNCGSSAAVTNVVSRNVYSCIIPPKHLIKFLYNKV